MKVKLGKFILFSAAVIASSVIAADDDPLYSPGFFWMWNDKLEPAKLCAQLEDMRSHGLRNVCAHPFPKSFRAGSFSTRMEPDYLTPEFLKIYAAVAKKARELGMHFYLYDEGGWPSGGACGLVAAGDKEGRFHPRRIGYGKDGRQPFGVYSEPWKKNPDYVSIIEKGATERFLELTHSAYVPYLGEDLGTTVRVAFTDEPMCSMGAPGVSMGWTSDFAEVFKAKKGYDILPHVKEMLARPDDTDDRLARLRIDYNDVMADLFVERYLGPIQKWCRDHGMLSGGHLIGEDVPERAACQGHRSVMRSLKAMDVPGVDAIWRQIYPSTGMSAATDKPFPRYASSVRNQCGYKFALTETLGIYGESMTPQEFKWVIDYQLVRGINTFVLAYLAQSYARQWMLLFEPHFGPTAPSWDMLPHLFGYIERCCKALSQGSPGAETVVLYDIRGIWAGGADRESAVAAHYGVSKALDRLNCDYDFTDDDSIAAAEVVNGGGLKVGAMTYKTVVLPTWKWMLPAAKAKLDEFERAGGVVVRGNDLSRVPRTISVKGERPTDIRVMKRVDGRRNIYFVMNEHMWSRKITLEFPEGGKVVRYDPSDDTYFLVSADGLVTRNMRGGETAVYYTGDVPACAERPRFAGKAIKLKEGWKMRPLVSYVAGKEDFEITSCSGEPKPCGLGDWRNAIGRTFSGKVEYSVEFDSPHAGRAQLDLGKVCWAASVKVNGRDFGSRFFGPFVFDVDVAEGRNEVKVTVANLLANQLGDPDIRARIAKDYPPLPNYERYQGVYDGINHDSGLIGGVSVYLYRQKEGR